MPHSLGAQAQREQADRFAANVLPVIREIQKVGAMSLRALATALNARGVKTARGGSWGYRRWRTCCSTSEKLKRGSPVAREPKGLSSVHRLESVAVFRVAR